MALGAMKKSSILLAAVIALLSLHASAQQDAMVPGKIRAVKVDGNVWQVLQSSGQRERLNVGDFLRQGNLVETAADGSAILLFDNGSTMNLRPGTKFSINEFLRDPFDAQKVDYKNLKNEPTRSVTKVKVQDGAIFFDIPKLSDGSTCDIQNPLGTAGIRGTAGFVAQDSMGVTEGLVQVQTQTGQTQSLGAGQSTAFTPQGGFTPPPASADQNMQAAQNNSQNVSQTIPANAFEGAPQTQAAAPGELTPEQQESIEQAAQEGQEAVVEAVKEIAAETPEAAAAAAAAAAALVPDAAPQIASAAAAAVPQSQAASLAPQIASAVAEVATSAAPQIAAAVAGAVTSAAPQIAAAVAAAVPQSQAASLAPQIASAVAEVATSAAPQIAAAVAGAVTSAAPQVAAAVAGAVTSAAPQIAAAVAGAVNDAAPQIAAAVTQAVPDSAPAVAGAVAGVVPSQATAIAQSVAQAAPSQASNIATAVNNAAPNADTAAVNQAAQQGAQQGNQANQGGNTSTGGSGEGGGSAPPLPSGGGGGGGGSGGGGSGGGGQYSN